MEFSSQGAVAELLEQKDSLGRKGDCKSGDRQDNSVSVETVKAAIRLEGAGRLCFGKISPCFPGPIICKFRRDALAPWANSPRIQASR